MFGCYRVVVASALALLFVTGCESEAAKLRKKECGEATSAVTAAEAALDAARSGDAGSEEDHLRRNASKIGKAAKAESDKLAALEPTQPEISAQLGAYRSMLDQVSAAGQSLSLSMKLVDSYAGRLARNEKLIVDSVADVRKECERAAGCDALDGALKAAVAKADNDEAKIAARNKVAEQLRKVELEDEAAKKALAKLVYAVETSVKPLEQADKGRKRADKATQSLKTAFEPRARVTAELKKVCAASGG